MKTKKTVKKQASGRAACPCRSCPSLGACFGQCDGLRLFVDRRNRERLRLLRKKTAACTEFVKEYRRNLRNKAGGKR